MCRNHSDVVEWITKVSKYWPNVEYQLVKIKPAYLVMFNIDMICTGVSCCGDWVVINWFIHIWMLFMSFVVVVPVNHLRASPRKGSKLLLCLIHGCDCPSKEGFVCNNFIVNIMVVLQAYYMSLMFVSSTCSIGSSWFGADGCWSSECSNCCVLVSCLLKAFQWHSSWSRETCTVMIQEWCVRYACRTGWKMTHSPNSFPDELVVGVSMNSVL